MTYPTDVDDFTEDKQSILEPSFDLDPQDWLEYDVLSAAID